ncbi:MAG: hypothetical protein V2I36_00790 [Desulfopila sp.]|nr:hypothetical protein [Desulfopila sp.]
MKNIQHEDEEARALKKKTVRRGLLESARLPTAPIAGKAPFSNPSTSIF